MTKSVPLSPSQGVGRGGSSSRLQGTISPGLPNFWRLQHSFAPGHITRLHFQHRIGFSPFDFLASFLEGALGVYFSPPPDNPGQAPPLKILNYHMCSLSFAMCGTFTGSEEQNPGGSFSSPLYTVSSKYRVITMTVIIAITIHVRAAPDHIFKLLPARWG